MWKLSQSKHLTLKKLKYIPFSETKEKIHSTNYNIKRNHTVRKCKHQQSQICESQGKLCLYLSDKLTILASFKHTSYIFSIIIGTWSIPRV